MFLPMRFATPLATLFLSGSILFGPLASALEPVTQAVRSTSSPGKELPLAKDSANREAFGVIFSLADDPNELSWRLSFSANLSTKDIQDLPPQLAWNLYLPSEKRFLLDWDSQRAIDRNSLTSAQLHVRDQKSLEQILTRQNTLVLILSDLNSPTASLLHLDIGARCLNQSTYFKNLTNRKTCSQITQSDVAAKDCISHYLRERPTPSMNTQQQACFIKSEEVIRSFDYLCDSDHLTFSVPYEKYLRYQADYEATLSKLRSLSDPTERAIARDALIQLERDWSIFGYRASVDQRIATIESIRYQCVH